VVKERVGLYILLPSWTFVACSRVKVYFTFTEAVKEYYCLAHYDLLQICEAKQKKCKQKKEKQSNYRPEQALRVPGG
jgi:hypothetical protein